MNYITRGKGPPVFLIHGLASSLYDWSALIPALDAAGFTAIAVDLLGHGDSPKPDNPELYTVETLYATLEKWIAQLGINPPHILVGHSLGGLLSLALALRYPACVRALILIAPVYNPKQLSPLLHWMNRRPSVGVKALERVPFKVIDTLLGWDPISMTRFSPQARRQIAIDYKRASPNILHIPRTIPDLTRELNQINIPTQIIWGEKDLTLKPRSFAKLVATLPNVSAHKLPDCGHQPHIGDPGRVNRLILDFLSSVTQY